MANVAIAVVFLELKQHKLSIANQVWARDKVPKVLKVICHFYVATYNPLFFPQGDIVPKVFLNNIVSSLKSPQSLNLFEFFPQH